MSGNTIKSWRLPYSKEEHAVAVEEFLTQLSSARGGFYPIGINSLWHGGIHLYDNMMGDRVLGCMAEGEVIAYRIDKTYPAATYGDKKAIFASSFTLVKHQLEIPQPPKVEATPNERPDTPATESDVPTEENAAPKVESVEPVPPEQPKATKSAETNTPASTEALPNTTADNTNNTDSAEPKENTSADAQAENTADVSKEPETKILTLYSLYMHLSDFKSYEDNADLIRPGYWQGGEYTVGEKAKDKSKGCVIRKNGGGTAELAFLPPGTQVRVGDALKDKPHWRKLEMIVSGTSLPALDTPTGYVYVKEMTPSPNDAAIYTVEGNGENTSDLAIGLNVRETNSSKSILLSCLMRGARIKVGEIKGSGKERWGKIDAILDGTAYPALTTDENGKLKGWVYLNELNEQLGKPQKTDEVVILDTPYPIKTGELIGYPGLYQKASEAKTLTPASLMTHIELFTCDDLENIIEDNRAQWKDCGEEYKNQTVVNKDTFLHTPITADNNGVAAQVELEKVTDSKTSGPWTEVKERGKSYSLIIAKEKLGAYKDGRYDTSKPSHKKAILDIVKAQDSLLTVNNIPGTVIFENAYYHNTDDSKFSPTSKTDYGRRGIRFTAEQIGPTFWVANSALNETGNRVDLTLTVPRWSRYPLQKGEGAPTAQPEDRTTGFSCLIIDAEDKTDENACRQKVATDSEGKRWHYVDSVNKEGQLIEGWVKEEAPEVTRHAPWEWPLFELVKETAEPQQLKDRMVRLYRLVLNKADRTPLMETLFRLMDTNQDGRLTPSEVQQALARPWLAHKISRLAVNYTSEWHADEGLSKWNKMDSWLREQWKDCGEEKLLELLASWQVEKEQRIKKLLWWDKLAGKHGLSNDGKAWFLHPAGMVGCFASSTLTTYDGKYTPADNEVYINVIAPKARNLQGPLIVFDRHQVLFKTHSLCRGSNDNRLKASGNGDTPTGRTTTMYGPKRHNGKPSYGNFGLIYLEGESGEFLTATKNGRAGIAIHSGHTRGYSGKIVDTGMLMGTFGCVRVYNSAMEELGKLYTKLKREGKTLYCYIEDYDGDINDVYKHYKFESDVKDKLRGERSNIQ